MALKTFTKEITLGTSGGFTGKLKLVVTEDSTDVSTNKSSLTYHLYLICSGGTWRASSGSWSLSGDVAKSGSIVSMAYYSDTTELTNGTFTKSHSSDGSGSISITMSFSSTFLLNGSDTLTGTLTNIPRKATLTYAPDFNDEQNPTITYSNQAGNSVASLQACIASADGLTIYANYRDISKTGTSYTFSLTETERNALRNSIPTSNSRRIRFYVKTIISGTTYVDSAERTLTLINVTPTVVTTAADTNKTLINNVTTQDLTGDSNKIIKYISNVAVSLSSTAKKGATISSQYTRSGGSTNAGSSFTYQNVETSTFEGSATDSRGNSSGWIASTGLTLIPYVKLTLDVELYRTVQTSNTLKCKGGGNYYDSTFGSQTNSLTFKLRYKESSSSTWSNWETKQMTINNDNTYSFDFQVGTTFDYTKTYNFEFQVEDKCIQINKSDAAKPGTPVISLYEEFIEMFGEKIFYK